MARVKPDSCLGCECYSHGTDFSAVEGTCVNGVLFVGEASGEMEAREGTPFVRYAQAGSVLERILRRMSLSREQFAITNVLRCRPKNNWLDGASWERPALSHCRPNLDSAIAQTRPRCIVALGGIALRELTGMVGPQRGITYLAGYVLLGPSNIPVIGDFHPAFLRRGAASHQGVFARILQRALNIAAGRDKDWLWNVSSEDRSTHGDLRYNTRPSLDEARSYRNRIQGNSGAVVSYDIETVESASLDEDAREGFIDTNIRLIQFSTEAGSGIAFPWEGEYREIARDILHTPNLKCGHHLWLFDNKVLRATGEREGLDLIPRGTVHDTLQMFHHWQPDLPAHLQFAASFVQFPFPWKHLVATDLEFYGCCDVDATLRLYNMLEKTLKRDQLWGDSTIGYIGQVAAVRPILAAMEDRGMPIDDAARLRLGAEFDAAQSELGEEIAACVSEPCKRLFPKEGYKGIPPEVKKWSEENGSILEHRFKDADEDGEYYCYAQREFLVPHQPDAGPLEITYVKRWCRVYDFNPNSRNQVLAYIRLVGHPVPKDKHREKEDGTLGETTVEKELLRLAAKTGDAFYLKVVEYRGLTKMRGTYIDGFAPGPDGKVHTTFTFDTGIGQLSSRNPNTQNFPKLKPTVVLAQAMRRMVAADSGHILTEWDFKSCHVITLGFLAEDLNYMRLGRLDIHSFVAGHFLGLWDGSKIFSESDDQLRLRFKGLKANPEWKRVRDDQAKHGILGIGNGLKARGLYERYMESFPPQICVECNGARTIPSPRGTKRCPSCKGVGMSPGSKVAERVLSIAEQLFPKVFAWQKRIQKLAHEQQFLKTQFGHIRRFYEVFRWDFRKSDWGHGDQAEEAIAFWLANIAFGHIREKMKELHRAGLDEKYGLFNTIHDSFMFHFPESMLEQHISEVHSVLTTPSTILRHPTIAPDGLVIDVEANWGKNWGEMQEINLQPAMRTPLATANMSSSAVLSS